jgi:soluble lytic murein transglycosylase-like protein
MVARSTSVPGSKQARRRALLAVLAALSFNDGYAVPVRANSALAARIARRYRVERSAVERVIASAEKHFPVDPPLLLAIVGVESSWRPWAVGGKGEVGLCQVRPDIHGASATELAEPEVNVRIAAKLLRHCFKRSGGDIAGAVARYNGRGDAANDYAARVLNERAKLMEVEEAGRGGEI